MALIGLHLAITREWICRIAIGAAMTRTMAAVVLAAAAVSTVEDVAPPRAGAAAMVSIAASDDVLSLAPQHC